MECESEKEVVVVAGILFAVVVVPETFVVVVVVVVGALLARLESKDVGQLNKQRKKDRERQRTLE